MMESGRKTNELTSGLFVGGPEALPSADEGLQQAEITAPGGELKTADVPPMIGMVAVSEIQLVPETAGTEAIDPVAAEQELDEQQLAVVPHVITLHRMVEAKGTEFFHTFFDAVRVRQGGAGGYYAELDAKLQVLQEVMPPADQEAVAALTAELQPAIERGALLEPHVARAAVREIAEYQNWLKTQPDWEKVVDAYLAPYYGEDIGNRPYRLLAYGIERASASPIDPGTDYRTLLYTRDTLCKLKADIVDYGDLLPPDQPWNAPEGWEPNPVFGTETRRWTNEVHEARKFLAPARQAIYKDESLRHALQLATLGQRLGLEPETV